MGRRPKNYQPPEDENDEPTPGDPPPTPSEIVREAAGQVREETASLAIEEILENLQGEEADVSFRKFETDGSDWQLERIPLDAVGSDINEFCRTRYGGGKYRAQFYNRDTQGKWKLYTERKIRVHALIPPGEFFQQQKAEAKPDESALSKAIDKIKAEGSGGNEMMLLFLKSMQEQSNLTMKMFMDSQANMMTALSGMFAAFKGGGGSGSQPLDMLQMLKVFKDLSGGSAATDPLKLLEFAHKLSKEMGGKDDEEPGWLKVLGEIIPRLIPGGVPPQLTAPPAGGPYPMPDAAAPTGSPGVTIVENPQPAEEMKILALLPVNKLAPVMLPKIIEAIENNDAEPEDALDMFNNPLSPAQLTEKQYNELVEILKADTWAEDLFGDEKKIEKHRAWFDKLRALILEEAAHGKT